MADDNLMDRLPSSGYQRVITEIYTRLVGRNERISRREFVDALRRERIASLLEIGPGNVQFLREFASVFHEAGIHISAIDLSCPPTTRHILANYSIEAIEGDARYLSNYFVGRRFDIILCVGVLSKASLSQSQFRSRLSNTQINRVDLIANQHLELVTGCLEVLDSQKLGGFFAAAPTTFLILDQSNVLERAVIDCWRIEEHKQLNDWFVDRLEQLASVYSLTDEEKTSYRRLWNAGADTVCLNGRSNQF